MQLRDGKRKTAREARAEHVAPRHALARAKASALERIRKRRFAIDVTQRDLALAIDDEHGSIVERIACKNIRSESPRLEIAVARIDARGSRTNDEKHFTAERANRRRACARRRRTIRLVRGARSRSRKRASPHPRVGSNVERRPRPSAFAKFTLARVCAVPPRRAHSHVVTRHAVAPLSSRDLVIVLLRIEIVKTLWR